MDIRFVWRVVFALFPCLAACRGEAELLPPARVVRLVRDTTLSEPLSKEFERALPGLEVTLIEAGGSVATVNAIQNGDADLGFALADVAYFAHVSGAETSTERDAPLRGIAALQVIPVHLLVGSRSRVRTLTDLNGLRIGTGLPSTGQAGIAEMVLHAFGIAASGNRAASLAEMARSLADGTLNAAFATAYYPAVSVRAAMSKGARLLAIEGAPVERLRREYPFIRSVVIPAGTYPGQDDTTRTIGLDYLLICRGDFDEGLVYDLTRQFLEALPQVSSKLKTSLRLMDLTQASATLIPLHDGAARYYREWELSR